MTPERWKQIDSLAQAALACPSEERPAFLAQACTGDDALRREVEALLAYQTQAAGFLEQPVLERAAAVLASPQEKLAAGSTIGHYQIIAPLGEGGMGEVYLARDTNLGRKVALKLLPSDFTNDAERLRRFKQEAYAASALNHPNIITIHQIGAEGDTHFIATEFIEGETLRAALARGPVKIDEVLAIAEQIASALVAAHKARIVHRDIKPENIMVRRDRIVKVLDFGLAKLALARPAVDTEMTTRALVKTNPGMVLGTVQYMSPEQARGLAVDARTDLWSLGCVLYELLAGRAPFSGDTPSDVLAALLERELPLLAHYVTGLPTEVEWIVQKALRKDREERYQTAKELLTDLKRVKQRLEFAAELERSAPPEGRAALTAATSGGHSIAGTTDVAAAQTGTSGMHTKSSAEYILSEIKQHRLAASLILATLVTAVIAVAYFVIPRYLVRGDQTFVPSPSGAGTIRAIAVLPFTNTSGNPETEYFSDGISESLINSLSQVPGLKVIGRSSSFKYKGKEVDPQEVANALGVEGIITGRVAQHGDDLLISIELVDARDRTQLWGEQYNRKASDVLAVLPEISREITEKLRFRLTPSEQEKLAKQHTSNPEAYNYYAKAMYHFHNIRADLSTRPEADLAVDLFKEAIKLDPNYALARVQLGYTYARIAVFLENNSALIEEAKKQLAIAERSDPQLAEVHAARYFIAFSQYEGWQLEEAIRELLLAQQLDPNVGHPELGDLYIHIGLEKQAVEEFETALKADPNNDEIKSFYINLYFISGRPDEALEASQRFFNRGPDFGYYLEKRMVKEAEPLVEQAFQQEPRSDWALVNRALLLTLQGKQQAAEAMIPSILKGRRNRGYHHVTYQIARIYALGGKSEDALKWLRVTVKEGFPCYPLFARDPFLDPIREKPAFKEFFAEMKSRWEGYQREFG